MKVSKTFALIVITILHFVTTVFFFFLSFSMVMAAFDGKAYGASYKVAEVIFQILSFPLVWVDNNLNIMFRVLPGPTYWLLYALNSFLWAWVLVNGFIWLRKRRNS